MFISATFHINETKTRIANYAQWENREAFEAMLERDDAQPHMAAAAAVAESFEPITYDVVYIEARQP